VSSYYTSKLDSLRAIFGARDVQVDADAVTVADLRFPVLDDVIVLVEPSRLPPAVAARLGLVRPEEPRGGAFAPEIQFTFGAEWMAFGEILQEHEKEFAQYFDLVDLGALRELRVADLGCGIGRWSYFLADRCRELVLVDFSEAIFVARRNLASSDNTLFFLGDVTSLPFADDCFGFLFCLGVLHHLPIDCLESVRALRRLAPRLLVFLYYALDNRPAYFRALLAAVTVLRLGLSRLRSQRVRQAFSSTVAALVYWPLVRVGSALDLVGKGSLVPLYDAYRGKSLRRIEQDVYDRFFTGIEQRVTRRQIEALRDVFTKVDVSPNLPFWHFTVER
jgi:SAM-dependent methyltransferase